MENEHAQHRSRMRERFAENGFKGFAEHEILEMVLFGALPRVNTNPIAHRLITRFGSFAKVCDASIDELTSVDGIGRSCAIQIKMIPELLRAYMLSHENHVSPAPLTTPKLMIEYLKPYFISRTTEALYILLLDNRSVPIRCEMISEGAPNFAKVDIKTITELCVLTKASAVVLAHNHPNGFAIPSKEDEASTKGIYRYLKMMGIEVLDHFIFTQKEAASMLSSKYDFRV